MNRYSLLFAMIVAATFVAPSPHSGDSPTNVRAPGKLASQHEKPAVSAKLYGVDPDSDIDEFLNKRSHPNGQSDAVPDVLFATVPHPIETHLAADFDANVAAIEEGLQDSGYLFDTAWIPWEFARPYDRLKDDETKKSAIQYEDGFPGILLFRKAPPTDMSGASEPPALDAYGNGLIVFLIAEKPTAGIEVQQLEQAVQLLSDRKILLKSPIRIAGPNYSGSLNSLGPALSVLHEASKNADFVIRGAIASATASRAEIEAVAAQMPEVRIDFGSSNPDYKLWKNLAVTRLTQMGMRFEDIAFLNEDESLYGSLSSQNQVNCDVQKEKNCGESWQIPFPRDISSLRTGYEKQGIFEGTSPAQPWKHFLDLKNDEQSDGDTVRSFGGAATTADQESVLFGISEFLKAHNIRAVVISATNPADAYFLSQFFHANNGGERIVIVGGTRLFMRGSTAQFRGDLVVDDFPMLPGLHDWTGGSPGMNPSEKRGSFEEHIFPTGYAQGAYMATLDLFGSPIKGTYPWVSEYSVPNLLTPGASHAQHPPMYLSSLGSDAPWPITLDEESPFLAGNPDPAFMQPPLKRDQTISWRVELPFTLFERDAHHISDPQPKSVLPISYFWITLYLVVWATVFCYCACFCYAEPVTRRLCASFEPLPCWRYWLFTVVFPGILVGCAFLVLAAPLESSSLISPSIRIWWHDALFSSLLAPLAITVAALVKAMDSPDPGWHLWKGISLVSPAAFACAAVMNVYSHREVAKIDAILDAYRRMHWESGLSLIPTWLLILLAFFLWSRQASHATARFSLIPILPTFARDRRVSDVRGECIGKIAVPIPIEPETKWLWGSWLAGVITMLLVVTRLPSFRAVTTLESNATTSVLLYTVTAISSLMLLDLLQFVSLWNGLRDLLRALDTHRFKRSFVPIDDFKWPVIWSFGGVSFYEQRAVLTAQIDCASKLGTAPFVAEVAPPINRLQAVRNSYRTRSLAKISIARYREDLAAFFADVVLIGNAIALTIESVDYPEPQEISRSMEAIRRALVCQCKEKSSRFGKEGEEAASLLDWQQASERLICLLYIGFIQTVIARLHGLMLSIAGVFSLLALAFAIYPFAPMSPFFLCGLTVLALIAWAFFQVFSQMDTDPILSRITNGDDRKLEWNFYGKFAEALALPLLTLVSSFMPGGVGRILDVARTLLSHSQ